ncbi:MAG: hypothetical protein ACRBN8_13405 [Nannocystales bacterium]
MTSYSTRSAEAGDGDDAFRRSPPQRAAEPLLPLQYGARLALLGVAFLFGGVGCESRAVASGEASARTSDNVHPTTIRWREAAAGLRTQDRTSTGKPVVVACSVCHAGSDGGMAAQNPQGRVVHASISLSHGDLSCYACHDRDNRDRLRLADGQHVEFPNAMRLCAQCHGPQKRDYDHGAHGGMNGYWDLSRGPRERNHCLACHGAHVPAYPVVYPEPPPADLERHE